MAKNLSDMKSNEKRGRNAQGQMEQRKMPNPNSEGRPQHDASRLNPSPGSCGAERKRKGNSDLNICTYNTRTLRTQDDLERLLEEIEDFNWDIIGLCETKRHGEGLTQTNDGIWIYDSGKMEEDPNNKGLGFIIHPRIKDHVKGFTKHSNRIISMNINLIKEGTMTIVQVYAPTQDYSEEDIESFYEDLSKVLQDNRLSEYTIVMGDFNAKIGIKKQDETFSCIGPFGTGTRNDRGNTLIEFAIQEKLIIANTLFNKPHHRYWTWRSPNAITTNQIDFCLVSQRGIVHNCEVITKVDIGSDHRMVRTKISISKKLARLKTIRRTKPMMVNNQALWENKDKFQLNLKNRFEVLKGKDIDIDERCEEINNIIKEESTKLAKRDKDTRKQVPTKDDLEIQTLDQRRKSLRNKSNLPLHEKIELCETSKLVKKKRRQRQRKRRTEKIESIIKSGRGPKLIDKDSNKPKICSMKKPNGEKTTDRTEILEICADFYKELYASKIEVETGEDTNIPSPDAIEIPPILHSEVQTAINQMKRNKAPGTDQVTTDIMVVGGEVIIQEMVTLFNDILNKTRIPKDWKEAKIIILFKKGDKSEVKNYRPISLLSHQYKIFIRVIHNRIERILDENQPRDQAGFRKGYSTTDHMQAINQIIEKTNEYNLPLYIGFVDFEKAFDSIEHPAMFRALRNIGINETYINLLEDIYSDATAKIHLDNEISTEIKISRGVRQGDPLSPKLFNATLEEVFKKAEMEEEGININGEMLSNLRFADDVAIFASSIESLERQFNRLHKESNRLGLKMHKGKTKYMTNIDSQSLVRIDNDIIEKVHEYKYLGQTLKMQDTTKEEVSIRIKSGWGLFGRYKEILCDKQLPISLKKRMFDLCVLPTITYGCQTWSTTKQINKKLATTQRAMERRMLGIKLQDRIPNQAIRDITKVKDIIQYVSTMKWKWAGHVSRMTDNRWTIRTTEWQPRVGKRSRGRPKKRWRDDITKLVGGTWTRIAKERHTWKDLTEGYILQWMDNA